MEFRRSSFSLIFKKKLQAFEEQEIKRVKFRTILYSSLLQASKNNKKLKSKVRGGGGVRTWVQPRFELPALRGGGGGGGGGGNNNIENLGLIFFSELSEQMRSTVLVFGL